MGQIWSNHLNSNKKVWIFLDTMAAIWCKTFKIQLLKAFGIHMVGILIPTVQVSGSSPLQCLDHGRLSTT